MARMSRKSLFFTLSLFLFTSCASIKVQNYQVDRFSLGNDDSIRIVQISDFHSNRFGPDQEKLLSKVRESNPDLIFLTGDIYDFYVNVKNGENFKNYETLLAGLKQIAPFYYVQGNHESFFDHNGEWSYLVQQYGGIFLQDESVRVQLKQGVLEITGIGDPYENMTYEERVDSRDDKKGYEERIRLVSEKAGELKRKLIEEGKFLFSVLLAHRPEYIEEYSCYDYDLIFSGHAHGGQWRFPPFNNGVYAPGQGLFPEYAGGKYSIKNGGVEFIVSRGLSYQSPRIPRIFNPPELVVVDVQ